MSNRLKIGILRETKIPPDRRVPLSPSQIAALKVKYPMTDFMIQNSDNRCFTDSEYLEMGIPVTEDLSECDILMGIKEVDYSTFIPGKTYLFFSHVGKKQPHNRRMLSEILNKKIRLIDYEYLTNDRGERVAAFGRFAGLVGAYNGLRALGLKTGRFHLRPAHQCRDLGDMWSGLRNISLQQGLKVVVTGEGRVSGGAIETLNACSLAKVSPEDFLIKDFNKPVFCQIGPRHYTRSVEGRKFSFPEFVKNPGLFRSSFLPFARRADLLVTGHYWDPRSPAFFSAKDMRDPGFRISVIADISCDIKGPLPSTLRATTIRDPFYDFDPFSGKVEEAFSLPSGITVMAVDNLPGELPGDASVDFGNQLINNIMDDLVSGTDSPILNRATITNEGTLTPHFSYLGDYIINNPV